MKLRPLRTGDTIALVSPASPLAEDKLKFIVGFLERMGLRTRVSPHALDSDEYLAGTDQDRAADLMAAFEDPETAAVLCTRGGYGCARLLPYLDFDRIAAVGKALMGFSDVTVLHLALNRRGLPTIHSPMALTLHYPREPWVYESFQRVLQGIYGSRKAHQGLRHWSAGSLKGRPWEAASAFLTDSIGTAEPLDAAGKILMIEDVDEAPHRVDAMLTHLRNTGIAQSAAGIVVGEMTRTDERVDEGIGGKPWREIVQDRLGDLGVPAVVNYPFGHMRTMLTVPLGVRARLDADAGTLTFLESPWEE